MSKRMVDQVRIGFVTYQGSHQLITKKFIWIVDN